MEFATFDKRRGCTENDEE